MKQKAFSLVEMMVVVVIAVVLLGVIFGVFITGRNSWSRGSVLIDLQAKTRLAMDRIVKELSSSAPKQVTIENCGSNCVGQMISFRIPVAANNGSIYDNNGDIIWGAEGTSGWTIQYYTTPDHKLVRRIPEDVTLEGVCCRPGYDCFTDTQVNCESYPGATYQGDGTSCPHPCPVPPRGACCRGMTCSQTTQRECSGTWRQGVSCKPNPCSASMPLPPGGAFLKRPFWESTCFAQDNITIITSDIQELNFVGTPTQIQPDIVKITIKARKTSILGEPIEVELVSTVTFRNK